jgi:hypothetical protein
MSEPKRISVLEGQEFTESYGAKMATCIQEASGANKGIINQHSRLCLIASQPQKEGIWDPDQGLISSDQRQFRFEGRVPDILSGL